jgi:2,3-bisphosphoglycerate-independent phosphoglycerate mutase
MNKSAFDPDPRPGNLRFVAMSDFGPDLGDILTAYPSKNLTNTLPMVLAEKRQLYIAETEKYAHITYFFNGGYADPIANESRILIDSPNVRKYDELPGMSTDQVKQKVIQGLQTGEYEFIVANIASLDMVAHTGNLDAAKEALVIVDNALNIILYEVKKKKGILIITSDHGNIEEMKDLSTGDVDTEHSKNPVPLLINGHNIPLKGLREDGILGDVAPTILDLFEMNKPKEMTGKSLLK